MPDANGAFKGTGWTRSSAAAWDRIFGPSLKVDASGITARGVLKEEWLELGIVLPDECCYYGANAEPPCAGCPRVPSEPSREVEHLADRTAAEADGWGREDYDQRRSAFKAGE